MSGKAWVRGATDARFSLLFRPGERPCAADLVKLAHADPGAEDHALGFAVSYQPEPADWVELLAGGMTFDLLGLAPAMPAPNPDPVHFHGLGAGACTPMEAISLIPGEPLRQLANLLPVMRAMTGLAARLAGLAGVGAMVWHPARCATTPADLTRASADWRAGGVFPQAALIPLYCDEDKAIRSEGLAFFTGQELWIDPYISKNAAVRRDIATRLVNQLVGNAPIHQPFESEGPNGEQLVVVPSVNDGISRVWRKT